MRINYVGRRTQSWGEIVFVWLVSMVVGAWVLMQIIAALHSHWWHQIPTIGFFPALFVTFLIRWFYATLTFDNTEN